ncbi:Penicillin-binding protein OS=Streptomyces glaucescens OX=1907 GN=SGLAU_14375 PE=3 SV=1 [Streptomyces glaucescens]
MVPESSVVAVKQSTGEVLAVANNRADGWNAAFLQVAPGSTMKTLSAAMLIDTGLDEHGRPGALSSHGGLWRARPSVTCPGCKPNPNATLSESFARSCNTAFVKFADEVRATP